MIGKALTVHETKPFWLSYPKVFLDISTKCNLKCPQCHRTDPNGLGPVSWLKPSDWTLDIFQKAFPPKILPMIPSFDFCGTWGDPLMNQDIDNIFDYVLYNSDTKIRINTNGSLRSSEWWWKLGIKGKGKIAIVFDVDGINQEMHQKYRVGSILQKVLDNMLTYTNAGGTASARMIVFKHNEDYIEDVFELCKEHGMNELFFTTPSDRWTGRHVNIEGNAYYYTENGIDKCLTKSSVSGERVRKL
tara:strand:+ start:986 stop:1720 length:735 start_codon:yes stop_codon:yes gene_type:complete